MDRYRFLTFILMVYTLNSACEQNKTKPQSLNIHKTAVQINGKNDSVINNSKSNYGNATVSDPCVKCLIQTVQLTDDFKKSVNGEQIKDIVYAVNWTQSSQQNNNTTSFEMTNALRIDVILKGKPRKILSSFQYDNSTGKIYDVKTAKMNINIRQSILKKIRNACFWGVASGK